MSVALRIEEQGAFPLTLQQERQVLGELTAHHRGRPRVPYNSIDHRQFLCSVRPDVLEQALNAVVSHHPAFRASIRESANLASEERLARFLAFERAGTFDPGLYEQVIEGICPVALRRRRVRGGRERAQHLLAELMLEEGAVAFHYGHPPLIRATLLEPSDGYPILVVAVPHLIVDAHSMGLFWHHLETCYDALVHQRPFELPRPSGVHYTDLGRIEREQLQSGSLDSAAEYWRRQWATWSSCQIAADEVVPSEVVLGEAGLGAASFKCHVGTELSEQVRAVARRLRVTPYLMFLAAFCLLLHRYTDRRVIAPWILLANRTLTGSERIVGWFANLHMVGIDLGSARTGRDLLRDCGRTITEALTFQSLPLVELWRRIGRPGQDTTRGRVFFDWFRVTPNALCPRTYFERLPIERRATTSTGVMVKLIDRADGFSMILIHPAGRQGAEGARRLGAGLVATVSSLAHDPTRHIASIVDDGGVLAVYS